MCDMSAHLARMAILKMNCKKQQHQNCDLLVVKDGEAFGLIAQRTLELTHLTVQNKTKIVNIKKRCAKQSARNDLL